MPGVSLPSLQSVSAVSPPGLPSSPLKAHGEPRWCSSHTKERVFIYVRLLPPHLDVKTFEESRFRAGDLEGEAFVPFNFCCC